MVDFAIERRFIFLWITILLGIIGVLVYREMPVELLPESSVRQFVVVFPSEARLPEDELRRLSATVSGAIRDAGVHAELLGEGRFGLVSFSFSTQSRDDELLQKLEKGLSNQRAAILGIEDSPRPFRIIELGAEHMPSMELALLPRKPIPPEPVYDLARRFSSHLVGQGPVSKVELGGMPKLELQVSATADGPTQGSSLVHKLSRFAAQEGEHRRGQYGDNQNYYWQESQAGDGFDLRIRSAPDEDAITLDGHPAVMLSVYRAKSSNDLELSQAVKRAVQDFSDESIEIRVVSESARYIMEAESNLIGNLIMGTGLACICILLFIRRFWATTLVSLSIPIALILSIPLLHLIGISRNVMSLAGAALGVGIVVDATLSTLSAFNERLAAGYLPAQAARFASRSSQIPLFVTSLSTLAVFVPILFLDGLVGSLFWDLSLTVITGQAIGFLVSVYLMPGVACLLHEKKQTHLYVLGDSKQRGDDLILKRFLTILGLFLKRTRWMLGLNVGLLALVAFNIYQAPPGEFLPIGDSRVFEGRVDIDRHASRDERSALAARVDSLLAEKGLKERLVRASQDKITVSGTGPLALEVAKVKKDLERITYPFPSGIYRVNSLDPSSRSGSDIEFFLPTGREKVAYRDFSSRVMSIPGVMGIRHTWDENRLVVFDDLSKSPAYSSWAPGHDFAKVNRLFQDATVLGYAKASALLDLFPEMSARAGWPPSDLMMLHRPSEADIHDLAPRLILPGDIFGESQSRVMMPASQHMSSGEAVYRMSVDIEGVPAGFVESRIAEAAETLGLHLKWHPRSEENRDGFRMLLLGLASALVMIAIVVFGQMRSLSSTFVTLCTFLWAPIGSVPGLIAHGESLSASALVGFILLAGTIVNNGILLVDRIEKYRHAQLDPVAACVGAARDRALPVVITSLTTILGSLPLVFESGAGSQMYRGLAIVLVYGTLISTPVSLFGVPSLVILVGALKEHVMRLRLRLKLSAFLCDSRRRVNP